MQQYTPEERLMRARVAIMRDPRFMPLSGLMVDAAGKCIVVDDIPTAATNGRDVLIGRAFINTIDDKTLRFVVLHEYYHVLFLHMLTWRHLFEENPTVANFAADAVINLMLDDIAGKGADGWLTVWPNAILDPQYRGMDTGEVYRRMMQQAKKPQPSAGGGTASQMDEHRPASGNDKSDSEGQGQGKPTGAPLTAEEAKAMQRTVDTVLRQAAIVAGKLGAKMDRGVKELLEVTVDWREVLKDFLRTLTKGNDMSTWRRPSRRGLAQDMYTPSRISEGAKTLAIGIDTSGSISAAQLRRALSEVVGVCESTRPETVHVICWDAQVASHEVYEGDEIATLADTVKIKGGGGTDPRVMAQYLNAKGIRPDCIVHFTDGYIPDWGQWPCPVLWCINQRGITAPVGQSLYVPE